MNRLWNRLNLSSDGAKLGPDGVSVSQVIEALEAGLGWLEVIKGLKLTSADLVAAIVYEFLGDDQSLGLPLVTDNPSRPKLRAALTEASLLEVAPEAHKADRLCLAAGLLQVADFWDASHEAAQAADDLGEKQFSPYWHGITHRREPDPGNASYWFRRVGRHPLYETLCLATQGILDAEQDRVMLDRLCHGGVWDSPAFIDLCSRARSGTKQEALARRLQRIEMITLLEATASGLMAI
jgi:hypothetical protein